MAVVIPVFFFALVFSSCGAESPAFSENDVSDLLLIFSTIKEKYPDTEGYYAYMPEDPVPGSNTQIPAVFPVSDKNQVFGAAGNGSPGGIDPSDCPSAGTHDWKVVRVWSGTNPLPFPERSGYKIYQCAECGSWFFKIRF